MRRRKNPYRLSLSSGRRFEQQALYLIFCLLLSTVFPVSTWGHSIGQSQNIEVIGVPPIPESLTREVEPYSRIYGLPGGMGPSARDLVERSFKRDVGLSR